LRWPRDTFYPLKLALTSPTSGGRSVGIVRSRTEAPDYVYLVSVTNNNGFCIWWLGLLALLYNYSQL
jgi:hypothetical protein